MVIQLTAWVFNDGLDSKVGYRDVPISCSLDGCAKFLSSGGPDYSYYMNLANYFNGNGSYIPISPWFLKAWPPGMGLYYAFLSKLTFNNSYFLVMHIIIMILAWCFLLTYPVFKSLSIRSSILKGILVVYVINLSLFKNWLFSGFIIYSETLGLLLLFSFIVIFCRIQNSILIKRPRFIILVAGTLLALAAYVRIVFDLAALTLLIIIIMIYLIRLLLGKNLNIKSISMRASLNICLIFLLLTLPWRFFAYSQLDSNSWTFASNSNGAWQNAWTPTENWAVDGNSYFVSVGINHLCVSYPIECRKLNESKSIDPENFRKQGINSIVSNPFPWIENRFRTFHSSFIESSSSNFTHHGWILSTILSLYYITKSLSSIFRRRFNFGNQDHLLTATSLILVGVTAVPLTLTAFEPRYLYTLVIAPWFILLYSNDIETFFGSIKRRIASKKISKI
jgi:hypothetical protein